MRHTLSSRFWVASLALAALFLTAVPLSAQVDAGYLRTRIKPSVAGIFVDGEYKGTAATSSSRANAIRLAPGEHTVTIAEPRYQKVTEKVTIVAGEQTVLRRTLERVTLARPPFGVLKIKNGARSAVYLNEMYFGQADEFNGPGQGMLLPPGEYHLKIEPLGGGTPHEEKIRINARQTTKITLP